MLTPSPEWGGIAGQGEIGQSLPGVVRRHTVYRAGIKGVPAFSNNACHTLLHPAKFFLNQASTCILSGKSSPGFHLLYNSS